MIQEKEKEKSRSGNRFDTRMGPTHLTSFSDHMRISFILQTFKVVESNLVPNQSLSPTIVTKKLSVF